MNIEVERGALPLCLRGGYKPWSIDVGHGEILLRGILEDSEDNDVPRLFDVLFQDVSRISIADHYSDLRIAIAENDEMKAEERRVGGNWRTSRMFLLGDGRGCDYIIAGFLFWAEVAVRANAPSPLMEESPTKGSIVGKIPTA
jgi:hypothetical protein